MTQPTPYFETPGHRAEFIDHLRQGTVPLKFAYAGSSAQTHDALARSTGYRSAVVDVSREYLTLMAMIHHAGLSEINLVEIGPGNGDHTVSLVGRLAGSEVGRPVRYLGLDFSVDLLRLAGRKIAVALRAEPDMAQWDVERIRTRQIEDWRRGDTPLVVLFLGSTLGNVAEPLSVLKNVHDSLRSGDILLLGVAMFDESASHAEVVAPYKTEVFHAAVLEPLRAIGVDVARCTLSITLDGRIVKGEVTLPDAYVNEELPLPPCGALTCFRSCRFLKSEVLSLLKETGWAVPELAIDDRAGYVAFPAIRT